MDTAVGATVRIDAKNGSFEGVIHSVDRIHNRLTLEKVHLADTKDRLPGRQHFFHNEIINIIVLEDVKPTRKVKESRSGKSIVKKKQIPAHLSRLKNLDVKKIVLSKHEEGTSGEDSSSSKGDGKASNSTDTEEPIAASYHILTEINKTFMEAIEYLSGQKCIGFAAEGIDLSRHGELNWIQMATREEVVLFDMLSLGKNGIEAGIGKILEDENVQKVIHDCRNLSDMFFHQYGVKLINIFDTQVAAAIVARNESDGYFSTYVDSLPQCLSIYLDIDNDKLMWTKYRERNEHDDKAVWGERPAPKVVIKLAVSRVQHLLDLRLVLMEKMLLDFTYGVDIFLSVLRDASPIELKQHAAKMQPHLLPQQFKRLHQEAGHRRDRFSDRYQSSNVWGRDNSRDDDREFKDTCHNRDPTVVFSHDSIWHENTRPVRPWIHSNNRRGCRANRPGSMDSSRSSVSGTSNVLLSSQLQEIDSASSRSEGIPKSPNSSSSPLERCLERNGLQISPQKQEVECNNAELISDKIVTPKEDVTMPKENDAEPITTNEQHRSPLNSNSVNWNDIRKQDSPIKAQDSDHSSIANPRLLPMTGVQSECAKEPEPYGRSITDLTYNWPSDDSDEELLPARNSHSGNPPQLRFIAAGYESMRSAVKPVDAPVRICKPPATKDRDMDFSAIPSCSTRSEIFKNPKDYEDLKDLPPNRSNVIDQLDISAQIARLSTKDSLRGVNLSNKSSNTSSGAGSGDSNDSGNESGHAFKSPRRGLGRGAMLRNMTEE